MKTLDSLLPSWLYGKCFSVETRAPWNNNSQFNTVVLGVWVPLCPLPSYFLSTELSITLDKAPPQRQKRGGVREREGGLLPTHTTPLFLILFLHSVVSSRCRELSAVFEQVLHDFSLLVIVYVRLSPLSGGVVVTGIVRVSGRFVCSCFIVLCSTVFERWVGWFSAEPAVYKVRLLILQELLVIEQQIPEGKGKELLDLHVISSRHSSSSSSSSKGK